MPNKFEQYQEQIDDFNYKYGLNFSLNSFDEKARVITEFASAKGLDDLYRSTFINLYKKVLGNCIDTVIGEKKANPTEYYRDFEGIMKIYRDVVRKEHRDVPSPNGGWKDKSEPLALMQKELDAIPKNKIDYAAERYTKGELRIRDMRGYVDLLKRAQVYLKSEEYVDSLAPLYCYKEALKKVHDRRSIGWTILNLPRYIGERNAIRKFEKYLEPRMRSIHKRTVTDLTGIRPELHDLYTVDPNEKIIDPRVEHVKALANDDSISKFRADVKEMISKTLGEPDPVPGREPIKINPELLTGKNAKIVEKINQLDPLFKDDIALK